MCGDEVSAAGDSPGTADEAAIPLKSGAIIEGWFHRRLDALLGRSCRIHRGVGAYGSGFLIGPDLIMTACHVADEMTKRPWPNDKIFISFPDKSLESSTVLGTFEIDTFAPIACCPKLDYAIVRIPVKVGLMKFSRSIPRGWFQICNTAFQELEGRSIVVLHWPSKGRAPRIPGTDSAIAAWSPGQIVNFNHSQHRGIHDAPTETGSSGGICLVGVNSKPLYLHKGTDNGFNVATSLASIAEHLRVNFPLLLRELEDLPLTRLLPRFTEENWPIINRDCIIKKILGMTEGGNCKPLFIQGASTSGRTFIYEILKTACTFAKHIKLDLASNLGSYQSLVSLLKKHCPQPDEIVDVYLDNEPIEAFFRRNLQNFLQASNRLAQQSDRLQIIFFDGLDVASDVVRDTVGHLSGMASMYPHLRILFAGAYKPLQNGPFDLVSLHDLARADYVDFMQEFRSLANLQLSDKDIEDLVDVTLRSDHQLLKESLQKQAVELKALCSILDQGQE